MLYALLSATPLLKPVPFVIEGMVEAQARASKERIEATSRVVASDGAMDFSYVIDVIRNREAQILVKETPLKREEIYYYKNNDGSAVAYAYHPHSGQYTQSEGGEQAFGAFIKAATPDLDDFLIGLIVPTGLAETSKRIDIYNPAWKMETKNGLITMTYQIAKASSKIVVNQKDLRLRKAAFENGAGGIIWDVKYSPIKTITPPSKVAGAYQVAQFDELLGNPAGTSAAAKSTLQKVMGRYEQPDSIAYIATTDNETTTVSYSKSYAYQSDNFATWSYDGKTLSLLNKTNKKFYSGPASRQDVIKAVAATGSRVEINLRSFMIGRNPYRLLLNDFSSIDAGKSTTQSGESADILKAKLVFADITMTVAKKDGFVLKVESTPIASDGSKLPKSISIYKRIEGGNLRVSPPSGAAKNSLSELLN